MAVNEMEGLTKILCDVEIEACEKRLAHEKKHPNFLERAYPDDFPPGSTAAAYELDLEWLRAKRARMDDPSLPDPGPPL